jgi:hypothetical protein
MESKPNKSQILNSHCKAAFNSLSNMLETSLVTEVQGTESDTQNTPVRIQSQHEANAYASVILSALPLPPLPVCCMRGEDNEDSVMSSHDLLARCMSSAALLPWTAAEHAQNMDAKQAILAALPVRLRQAMSNASTVADAEHQKQQTKIHTVFANTTREYIAVYFPAHARKNLDFRVLDVSHVSPSDTVLKQAREHLRAHVQSLYECNEITAEDANKALMKTQCNDYATLLQTYAELLIL